MNFTIAQQEELAIARETVARLQMLERAAHAEASRALVVAGVEPTNSWDDIFRNAADIRDALAPFDDGIRS